MFWYNANGALEYYPQLQWAFQLFTVCDNIRTIWESNFLITEKLQKWIPVFKVFLGLIFEQLYPGKNLAAGLLDKAAVENSKYDPIQND